MNKNNKYFFDKLGDSERRMEKWVAVLTRYVEVMGSIKDPFVSLSKKLCPYCLVLVGSRNGFERDFTIELK